MIKRDDLFPYLMISLLFHSVLVYFAFHSKEKPTFSSVPIEVFFYSSSQYKMANRSSISTFEGKIKLDEGLTANETKITKGDRKEYVVIKKKRRQELKEEQKIKGTKISENDGENNNLRTLQIPSPPDNFSTETPSQYGIVSFDNPNFKYSYYARQIVRKIGRQWRWVERYGQLKIIVHFRIHRNGSISDVFIKESSGNAEYDKYALDTIHRSTPFPDLPEDYEYNSLGVYFEFKYKN